jgi:glycosyltransferase involved in cell wall biosynthesis
MMTVKPLRILQLTPRCPYPLHDGGAIGMYNITKYLSLRGHSIRMVSFSTEENYYPPELTKYCSLRTVGAPTGHSVVKLILSQFKGVPYMVLKYKNDPMQMALQEEMDQFKPDVLHIDHFVMAQYGVNIRKSCKTPMVLREHNFETKFLRRFAQQTSNPIKKLTLRMESRRMVQFEVATCEQFDRCAMITHEDEAELKSLSPKVKTTVIPAGVEIPPESENNRASRTILFLASLDWQPNVDGFFWFYREVLPLVVQMMGDATVHIVGRGKSTRLSSLHDGRVKFIGFVDDVAPYIRDAAVCIVPLHSGSGMRIKILEMMAQGKAVVATSVGAEGIEVESGKDILIADSPQDFAGAVVQLLQNHEYRDTIGASARLRVRQKYDWSRVAERFENVYYEVCASEAMSRSGG